MKLESFLEVMWRQRIVVASVLLIGLVCFGFALMRGSKYSASSVILAGAESAQQSAVLDPTKNPIESAISPMDLPMLLHSSTVMKRVAADVHLTPEHAAKLAGNVKAKPQGEDTIPITVTDSNPQLAVAEANALAHELQRFEQQIAESRYDLLISDLNTQLASERTQLGQIDQKIAGLTSADPYLSDKEGTAALNTRLVALEAQRDTVQTQLLGDSAAMLKAAERPTLTRDLASKEIVQNDPVFQSLRTQYGKDLANYNLERAGYTSNFAGLAGAQDQVKREAVSLGVATAEVTKNPGASLSYVTAELDKNKAEATYAGDRAQLQSLNDQIGAMTAQLATSKNANVSLDTLVRDRDAGNQAYAQIADRLALAIADRSQAASVNSIVILDEAASASPTMLSRPAVIFAALLVAFSWLAISLAYLVDQSDGRLRTRTTIEELYGSPVLTNVV
jgi:uncharacterized protein involved in exopolysaccharide biosynthesis